MLKSNYLLLLLIFFYFSCESITKKFSDTKKREVKQSIDTLNRAFGKTHSDVVFDSILNPIEDYHDQDYKQMMLDTISYVYFSNAKVEQLSGIDIKIYVASDCPEHLRGEADSVEINKKKFTLKPIFQYADGSVMCLSHFVIRDYYFEFNQRKYLAIFYQLTHTSSYSSFLILFEIKDQEVIPYYIGNQVGLSPLVFSDMNKDGQLDFILYEKYSDTIKCYTLQNEKMIIHKGKFIGLKKSNKKKLSNYEISGHRDTIDLSKTKWFFDLKTRK